MIIKLDGAVIVETGDPLIVTAPVSVEHAIVMWKGTPYTFAPNDESPRQLLVPLIFKVVSAAFPPTVRV